MTRAADVRRLGMAGAENNTLPGYLEKSSRPFASLLLLLPLIVLYEVGTRFFTTAALHGREQQIIAFSKMQQFFLLFGATGRHLPALAVIASLLAWHIVRNDSWRVDLGTLLAMALESVVLSLPLFLLGILLARYFPLMNGGHVHAFPPAGAPSGRDMLIMSMGAGVYEEFVFRLAGFALLSLLFRDTLQLRQPIACLLMVVASALLFSAYHYWDTSEQFVIRIFAFRTLAGAYFGTIFLLRGFGLTASAHSIYDLIFTATLLT
jgi:hypothetical protein